MTILVIGMICYDVVNTCDRYPHEDEEMRLCFPHNIVYYTDTNRCLSQREQQGGNAANSSYVLGLLNARCEFFGNVGKGFRTEYVETSVVNQTCLHQYIAAIILHPAGKGLVHEIMFELLLGGGL